MTTMTEVPAASYDADLIIEAERFILGTALIELEHTPGAEDLTPGDFYRPTHGVIHGAITAARAANEPGDPTAIAERLRAAGDLQRIGGLPYLHDLAAAAMGPGSVPHQAGIIRAAARRRERVQVIARLNQIAANDEQWETHGPSMLGQLETGERPAGEPSHLERLRAALLDSAGLDSIPDPEPLIGEDILFRDSLAWMVGKPGHGKSFVALDMAAAVGTGEAWQTYPVTQGPVLFLVAEGARGTKKRVRAWEKAMGRKMTGVYFLPLPVQATNRAQWDALVELARELQAVLIVIDTQARVTVGVEENSNTEMGEFVDQAEKLRAASSACVVIVHHIGRNGDTGRGATVLDGALSTIIKVSKDEDRIKLECTKNKDDAEWDDISLRAVPTGEGKAKSIVLMLDDGKRSDDRNAELSTAARRTGRTWWENHADTWVGKTDLVDVVAPKSTLFRHLTELKRAGLAEQDNTRTYPRYRLTPVPGGGPWDA